MRCVPVLLCVLLARPASAEPRAYGDAPGAHAVVLLEQTWVDASRADRQVPVRVYAPDPVAAPAPAIIFSHGLGGSRRGGEYLGRFWASHGYICIHLQHAGSDEAVWKDVPRSQRRERITAALLDPTVSTNRLRDVSFALDVVEQRNSDEGSPMQGWFDLEHIGVAGHSYGAWTANMVGGQAVVIPRLQRLRLDRRDERVDAILPLSSPVPPDAQTWPRAFASMAVPALHMTGTADDSPVRPMDPIDRRAPYDHTPAPADGGPDAYLLVFNGGDHMTFAGQPEHRNSRVEKMRDERFHALIKTASLAFWDAYLRGDQEAARYLADGGFAAELGALGTIEARSSF